MLPVDSQRALLRTQVGEENLKLPSLSLSRSSRLFCLAHFACVFLSSFPLGFRSCYVSGGALSAQAGLPDTGFLTLPDFTRSIAEVRLQGGG